HKWSDNSGVSWSSWVDLGAPDGHPLYGTPALVSDYAGRLYVVSSSADGGVWLKTYNQGWSGWSRIAGQDNYGYICQGDTCYQTISQPVITSWGPGRLDLFSFAYPNTIGHQFETRLLHTWADNSSWSGQWEDLGPTPTDTVNILYPPAAVSWSPGRID